MTDLTVSIGGSRTVAASNLTDLSSALEALTQAHEAGDAVRVESGALRWRDGGVWIQVNLAMSTTVSDVSEDKDALAQVAVDTGLKPDLATAEEEMDVTGA